MCGIVGAVAQRNVVPILIEGLRRLEYRGYDSAGLAIVDGELKRLRSVGRVAALETMAREFGTRPGDVTAVLGPCIRPPHYEIDFAAEIARQAERAGVADFADCGENTAADLSRHYSYRMELGKTGRMMALIVRD